MNVRLLIPFVVAWLLLAGCAKDSSEGLAERAANEEVASFMRNFEGRGALTDPDSKPTSPAKALAAFKYPDDLVLELVLAEPDVVQPVQMSFDHRGRLWVVQYHQYPYPEGLKVTDIDNHTRVKFDKVPEPPPSGVKGADKISCFEDTDGDGDFDKGKDVISGLNIATGVALGREKVWVLNPPYLLAYPDTDGDGMPNGTPEVHLEGFGLEDTHAVANSLTWGPDGWLYGAQGSTTTSNINSAVTKNVRFLGQAIWRYHPASKVFEIFAEGGGNNPFNVEFDSKGRIFSGSNGQGRGPYYKQGAYYVKSWGKHGPLTNPYAFGFLPNMPLKGEKKRFTHSLVVYEGGRLPDKYQGKMFALNPLHNFVQQTSMYPLGSSFGTVDEAVILSTDDKWFRPVDIKLGPDGAIYICDWYDSRLSHVDPRDTWHKNSGRVYRLRSRNAQPEKSFDMSKLSNPELVSLLGSKNKWYRQQALRQIGDRRDSSNVSLLLPFLAQDDSQSALEALWAINLSGGFSDKVAEQAINSHDPYVRMWTVRLLGDAKELSPGLSEALRKMALKEVHPEVRSQVASSAKRLPAQDALPLIHHLLQSPADADDPDIPLLIWWAIESKMEENMHEVISMFEEPQLWKNPTVEKMIINRVMQRLAMAGTDETFTACARLINLAPTRKNAALLIGGLQEGLIGKDQVSFPPVLTQALRPYESEMGEAPLTLALRRGEAQALRQALHTIEDENASIGLRLSYLEVLAELPRDESIPVLLKLVRTSPSASIKRGTLHALSAHSSLAIGEEVLRTYPMIRADAYVRESAIAFLLTRREWAEAFLREIEETRIVHKEDVPDHLVKRFLLFEDPRLRVRVEKIWPAVRPLSSSQKSEGIKKYTTLLRSGTRGNVTRGRDLYLKNCGMCHRLFDEGGTIGPELTGYDRKDVGNMVLHLVDPGADIREGYELQRVSTVDGRVLEGRITHQTGDSFIITPPLGGKPTTLLRNQIADMRIQNISSMPERLLESMTEEEVADFFSYLSAEKKPE